MAMSVSTKVNGPIRATLELHERALGVFKRSEANAIIRAALTDGAEYWIAKRAPQRFRPLTASLYGYKVSQKYKLRRKNRRFRSTNARGMRFDNRDPLVMRGDLVRAVASKARIIARSTKKAQRVSIAMNAGHAMKPKDRRPLMYATAPEIDEIAEVIGKALEGILASAQTVRAKRGVTRTLQGATSRWRPQSVPRR